MRQASLEYASDKKTVKIDPCLLLHTTNAAKLCCELSPLCIKMLLQSSMCFYSKLRAYSALLREAMHLNGENYAASMVSSYLLRFLCSHYFTASRVVGRKEGEILQAFREESACGTVTSNSFDCSCKHCTSLR